MRARSLSRRAKDAILERDGHVCHYCGDDGATHVDHKVAWINGGTDEPENLVAACYGCNISKGKKDYQSFKDEAEYLSARGDARKDTRFYRERVAPALAKMGPPKHANWCQCPDCNQPD